MRCDECRFWDEVPCDDGDERVGDCRRYVPAPVLQANGHVRGEWPETTEEDWCGEFESKAPSEDSLRQQMEENVGLLGLAVSSKDNCLLHTRLPPDVKLPSGHGFTATPADVAKLAKSPVEYDPRRTSPSGPKE